MWLFNMNDKAIEGLSQKKKHFRLPVQQTTLFHLGEQGA